VAPAVTNAIVFTIACGESDRVTDASVARVQHLLFSGARHSHTVTPA